MNETVLGEAKVKNTGKHSKEHTVRTRSGGKVTLKLSPRQAIFAHCTECLGWETHPKDCTAPLCPLYCYRGKTFSTNDVSDLDMDKLKEG